MTVDLRVTEHGNLVLNTCLEGQSSFSGTQEPERVSALMVTRGRPGMAMRSILCFLAQSYLQSELVVIDGSEDTSLAQMICTELSDELRRRIIYECLPSSNTPLGELRNHSVRRATGSLICQWDDDDLYHPDRIAIQIATLQRTSASACSLWRHQMLWQFERRVCHSVRRVWEGSLMCRKDLLPPYPPERRGEDTPVVEQLFRTGRYALIDEPCLYTYIIHGTNTFDKEHFERHWLRATARFDGDRFEPELRKIVDSLPPQVAKGVLGTVLGLDYDPVDEEL